ncbi:hypothetical protein [Planomonospora sp. ID82291]|uniref:hypothetical protein n=1 Tax=Planomonospora sp. ID82291 TaxID=2738136 RepID=UPI0018C3535D|nr:hypothetical protein [Planomonospora sp. ID82291]MBG0815853.1 hypothetical protein [Planomonospora sp. ID82291]
MVGQHGTYDFTAGDRRERAILWHMMLSLVGGLLLGAFGEMLAPGPGPLVAAYDPYAYLLLALAVGRTATGLGWAALAGTLAALGPVVPILAAGAFPSGYHPFHVGAEGTVPGVTLLAFAVCALLAYATRRKGPGGDLAAALPAGVLMIEAVEAAQSGAWSVQAAAVLVLAVVLSLRRGAGAVRSALAGAVLAAAHLFLVAGP